MLPLVLLTLLLESVCKRPLLLLPSLPIVVANVLLLLVLRWLSRVGLGGSVIKLSRVGSLLHIDESAIGFEDVLVASIQILEGASRLQASKSRIDRVVKRPLTSPYHVLRRRPLAHNVSP